MHIAVLLTTYNRRKKTLACLHRLQRQRLPANTQVEVFLTDDASSDGTAEAVLKIFPGVHVYNGTGSLYWAGGMRQTWEKARSVDPDYYLLLNDDTDLREDALSRLLYTTTGAIPTIGIGNTVDEASGKMSYGGYRLRSKHYWKSEMIHDEGRALECDFASANIMLIPRMVVNQLGILSGHFTHSLADYDYTLKARKQGIPIKVAPGFLGACVDDHGNNWKSANSTLRERIAYLKDPKRLAYKEYLRFIKDHFPMSYPAEFVKLWMKTLFPVIWDKFKKR